MPLDPRIILQGRGVDIGDPLQQYGNALQMQRLQDADARENAGRNALRKFYGAGSRAEDLGALAQEAPDAYAAEVKRQQELAKDKASTDRDATAAAKARAESAAAQLSNIGNMLGTVRDQASYEAVYQQALRTYGPEAMAQIPPQYDPQTVAAIRNSSLSLAQEITNRLQARNAAVGERNAATAEGRLQIERDAPKGVVVQTPDGPMVVDPRAASARPVVGPNGQQVRPAAPKMPQAVVSAVAENRATLKNIDDALATLETPEGENATGLLKGMAYAVPGGENLVNYFDQGGLATRALVANIGSKVIHDRSGAAVTISEMPRLAPFIPQIGDPKPVVKQKLEMMRRNIAQIDADYSTAYGTPAQPMSSADSYLQQIGAQ